jgi:hypothetical protein
MQHCCESWNFCIQRHLQNTAGKEIENGAAAVATETDTLQLVSQQLMLAVAPPTALRPSQPWYRKLQQRRQDPGWDCHNDSRIERSTQSLLHSCCNRRSWQQQNAK